MDYSKFTEFPFPSGLSEADRRLKDTFLDLPDEEQLSILNGCTSYEEFHEHLTKNLH